MSEEEPSEEDKGEEKMIESNNEQFRVSERISQGEKVYFACP